MIAPLDTPPAVIINPSQALISTASGKGDIIALYLSIDGGGTKTSVSIAGKRSQGVNQEDSELEILGRGSHDSSNYADVGLESAMLSIGKATVQALQSLPDSPDLTNARGWNYDGFQSHGLSAEPAPFSKIWAGLSGVDSEHDRLIVQKALRNLFGLSCNSDLQQQTFENVKVTNDCDLLSSAIEIHYKANKDSIQNPCKGGIVLIAGTGSIATAFAPKLDEDESNLQSSLQPLGRLGGYGYLLGDEGSAFYVGRQTIKKILAFGDRQPKTKTHKAPQSSRFTCEKTTMDEKIKNSTLLGLLLSHFQIDSFDKLLASIYAINDEHGRKIKLAEISRIVMKCAFQGQLDPFARSILEDAAKRLSELVLELCDLHHLNTKEMVLCLGGGMWTYVEFKDLVLQTMKLNWNADWGWVETIDQPDRVAVMSLA